VPTDEVSDPASAGKDAESAFRLQHGHNMLSRRPFSHEQTQEGTDTSKKSWDSGVSSDPKRGNRHMGGKWTYLGSKTEPNSRAINTPRTRSIYQNESRNKPAPETDPVADPRQGIVEGKS
jgi:hypothetical protein